MVDRFYGTTPSPFDTLGSRDPRAAADRAIQEIDQYARSIRAGLVTQTQQMMQPEVEPTQRTARVAYDPTQGKYFIGGFLVDENNDTDIATMAKFAGQEAPLPEGNWQTVDDASFAQYVQSIRSPDTLKLMAKNFGMGFDEMQQMAGLGLQWLGAEELGRGIVAQQERDLAPNQIYNRNFTDIGSSPEQGVLDWMAATIGRLGPNIVESTISAAIGAGIGTATTGPAAAAGAPIGAIAGFFGKTAVKKALLEAAKKQLKGEALDAAEKKLLISAAATSSAAKEALEKQAKKQALTAADEAAITSAASANALMDTTRAAGLSRLAPGAFGQYMDEALTGGAVATRDLVNRRARQVGGAAGASFASNLFQQTGAAYGETMADGGPGDRAVALAVGIPGALADTIPEFILAGRLFSELGGDVVGAAKKQKSAMDILKGAASGRTGRVAKGVVGGAAIEGGTEGFQEVLQIAANPVLDLGSAEASSRIINALAGGALLGGGFGGAGGIFAGSLADNKQEANLLLPVSQNDPNYAQYRADLKAKLGEAEYNKVFGPPQPYTRLMEESAAQGVDQTPAEAEADWQRLFGYVPATRMQSFPPPAEPFAAPTAAVPQGEMFPGVPLGAAPMAPPVAEPPAATPDMLAQGDFFAPPRPPATLALPPASTVYVPPTGPEQIGPPPTPESDWQRLFGYVPNTENLAPTPRTPQGELLLRGGRGRAPARVPPSPIPEPSADLGGVQGILQPRREFPDTYGVSSTAANTQLAEGLAPLRRQMEFEQARQQVAATRVTPAERDYTEAAIGQSIELDIDAVVSPDKLGKKLTPNERDRRKIIAGFNSLKLDQQERILVTFNNDETQLIDYVRREKPPVVRKQFATLARVPETTFEVAIPKPLKEKTNAPQPGAGTGSAAPAGKQGSQDGGAGKSGPLRKSQQATSEAAPEGQGTPTRRKPLQAEAAVQPAVEPAKGEILKKKPPSPKGEGVAASPKKEAAEPELTDREVWEETFDDKGVGFDKLSDEGKAAWKKLIARKGGFTVADAEQLQAQFAPKKTDEELAVEVRDKAKALIKEGLDNPNLPIPQNDLEELYFAVAKVRTTDGVDFSAALSNLVSFLGSGYSREAQRAARAYIDANIEEVDVTVAKARLAAANKKAMEADKARAEAKKAAKAMEEESKKGRYMLSTFDLVENPIDENGRPAKGVNPIRVKAIVDKFRSGLAKAPQFYVYKNQADLQRRNPALYQQAVGSRPQGDFDTARASGFAFDGKVLVFTDRIPTEKYMRLLLAHESIGHFGMRALLPASKFDALMDYVYENNMAVRRAADSKLAGSTDLGARREAVEEYMAKYAEKLDSSVITRVWNAIKDVLNKLGIKFEDDIVRYLVSQARRTVREGSSMFTPSTFALNVHTITTNNGTGRFSTEPIYTAQHELSNAFYLAAPPPYNLDTARKTLKDYKIDSADKLENFLRNVFRLRNFNALRNHGAQRFEYLKDAMRVAAQTLRNVYNEKLAGLLALSGQSRHVVSYALIVSRRIADRRFMLDKELRNSELIVLGDEQPDGTRALDINKPIFERLLKMGTLSRDELNNGAEVTYEEPVEGGKTVKTTVKIPGVKEKLGRDLTDNEYNIYVKTRRDLAELDVERLKGQLQNFIATEEITTKGIRKVLADKNMTDADVAFVKSIVNHAKKLHLDDIEYDERGMPTITPKAAARMEQYFAAINNAVVKREFTDDLKAEVRKFYLPKQGRDEDGKVKEPSAEALAEGNKKSEAAIKRIEEFRSRRTEFTGREEQSVIYTLQDRIKEIVLADAAFEKAQMAARRSIGSSHVPLWREGSWQVRVEAQINGRAVKLHPEVQNKLLFSLHTQRSESENAAAEFNDGMKDLEYSGLVYNEENGEYKTQTFKLFAVPSKVVESVASEPSIDIDNFLYTLRVLGQPLAPDKHAKAITMLTAPGSALRKALRFDDTPGYDPLKSVEAIARHVTTRSSLIARTKFQPHMRDLMDLSTDTGKLWFGDAEAVMTAKENLDKATTADAKAYWQDKLTTDLYKYVTTNPGAKGWDGSRAKFPGQPKQASLGMRDYSDSVKEMEWMQDSSNINESTFEGKRLAAGMKMITSIAFLGGMFTQFAQNLMSPATNVMPYLASKDSQTGFGGGFGMAVMPTYLKAFKDVVGFRGLNPFSDPIKDAEAFDKIASDIKAARDTKNTAKEAELTQQYGLSYYEALNIAREIREGKLIPAQANALLETARGMFTGPISKGFLKFSDFYMSPFNVSEQATRRATFLTAFRLEFDRLVKAGFNEDKASEMARMFAVDTVDKTLGEYSNTNRPPVWRDGWQSLLFVYKTYPLTSLLLFKNLSRAGKIGMLTSLYVLAGAAGFPLVDDMEDLIDTLSQRLGLDLGQGPAVRMAIIRQLEEVFPGWSDMILRGPLNHYTGADVGAKFGLEDFIPGTGILLKGANTTEELKGIAGPVVGMGLSVGKFLYDAARAPLSSTVSFTDVARESPFSLMRAGGDVAAYLQNGAIVDRRGYVVSPEVNAMTMLARLAGFYPAEAAKQYDFIKYANRMNYDYKEVGMAYKLAWIKAKKAGNEREAARIVREVNEWNEANKGGPGVIRNFLKNAQRQLKEANRPAGERFLKSAPVASRAEYDRFLEYITGE